MTPLRHFKRNLVFLLSSLVILFVLYEIYGTTIGKPNFLTSPAAIVTGYLLLFVLGVLAEGYQLRQARNDPDTDPTFFVAILVLYSGLLLPDQLIFGVLSLGFLLLYAAGWFLVWRGFRTHSRRGGLEISILIPLLAALSTAIGTYTFYFKTK